MNVSFTENAWEDYLYWQKTDKKIVKRINELIKDINRNPFEGLGKPEPLKGRMDINRNTPDGLISGAFLLSLTDFSNFMLLSNVVALLLSQYLILEFLLL